MLKCGGLKYTREVNRFANKEFGSSTFDYAKTKPGSQKHFAIAVSNDKQTNNY